MRILLFCLLLVGSRAFAFPDMVRHGYTHCNSCHTQLSGGGLLNDYGRSLSREVLSAKSLAGFPSHEGDENFAYGLIKRPEWLLLQSDVRILQAFVESKTVSRARFMIMQVDLDASARVNEHLRFFGAAGRVEPLSLSQPRFKDYLSAPRLGAEYTFTKPDAENRITLRAGRFMPAYGIGFAEHKFFTRRLFEFEPGMERGAAEATWANDHTSVIATGIFNRYANNDMLKETGGALQVATAAGEKSKVGVNGYYTERKESGARYDRRILGAFAHIGFSKEVYGLLEVDQPKSAVGKWGLVELFKLGWEVQQGWHLFVVQEFANLDASKSNPRMEAFSAGTEWFPRPHWDLYALYRRERDTSLAADFQDQIWLIAHFYL